LVISEKITHRGNCYMQMIHMQSWSET